MKTRFAIAVVFTAFVACSSRESFDEAVSPPIVPQDDAGIPEAQAPQCGLHCSRDLKQVLDGCVDAEKVVETCSADQGCGEGRCVDACAAAALSKGSAGCDFWTVAPSGASPDATVWCFAAVIANTWDRGVDISAEYGDRALDISKSTYVIHRGADTAEPGEPNYEALSGPLPPGEVAVVFLAHDDVTPPGAHAVACPAAVTPATRVAPIDDGTVRGKAFRIKTDAPVSAYSMAPYGGARSYEPTSTLLMPVSSWSTNYVAVVPGFTVPREDPEEWMGGRTLQIVAQEDGTEVRIRPTVDVWPGRDVEGARAGSVQTWKLAKGEVLQLVEDAPLSGSPIESNKPIGVFGGAECTFLPARVPWCDMLQQQIPAVDQWGTEYAVVPFPSRLTGGVSEIREQVPYTIVGAADGTVLAYDPARPKGAPEALQAGQSVDFVTDEFFVVKSQDRSHPFHVDVYMSSRAFGGGLGPQSSTTGDPEFVNVPPADQFLDRYVFFTDFTYPDTSLTIVRRKRPDGFAPVELACGGEIGDFRPLGLNGLYEYAWVKLSEGYVETRSNANGPCGYGRQEARSDGPFAVTVWGTGVTTSYGYVAGTGLRPISDAPRDPLR